MLSAEPLPACGAYAVPMVASSLRALWNEPRPAGAPTRVWRDWALLAVVVAGSALEVMVREDRSWLAIVLAPSVVIALSLLWRRTRPLAAVTVAFGTLLVFDLARLMFIDVTALSSVAAALVLSYALLRWGSGRETVLGLVVIAVWLAVTHLPDPTSPDEVLAGYGFFLFAAALGASVRFHTNARLRDIEQTKLRLRHELARELHDTVGHHVSAIAIQAQAGLALAASDPDRAVAVLETIDQEASRTMDQMRTIVGLLREQGAPDLAPQPGLTDIERLARNVGDWPRIDVHLSGDLDDLAPAVSAALYRITQEAITNAVRHARNATRVNVEVGGDPHRVQLTVHDDGDTVPTSPHTPGYGLLGMAERTSLLGGELRAGPDPKGGWTVNATLPASRPTTALNRAVQPPS